MKRNKYFNFTPKKEPNKLLENNAKALKDFEELWDKSDTDIVLIEYAQLDKVPFFAKYEIAYGWTGWKFPNPNGEEILFLCHVLAGETLIMHEHDCWEKCITVEGELKGLGKIARFKPFTPHEVTAKVDSILLVKFSRKYIK